MAKEYAKYGATLGRGFVPVIHIFNNAQAFDNSYFSFFESDEELFIDKSEFILSSIETTGKGFKLIWDGKK